MPRARGVFPQDQRKGKQIIEIDDTSGECSTDRTMHQETHGILMTRIPDMCGTIHATLLCALIPGQSGF